MNITKFEEKAMEFIEEHNLFVPCSGIVPNDGSRFRVRIVSLYKEKSLDFCLFGLNCFNFEVRSTNLDELFEKALRVLKAYGSKGTRERNKTEESSPEETDYRRN